MATPPPLPSEGAPAQKQRVYQALCPGCGAPVAFFSASSTHAVCGFCQSTVVRDGDTLQRTGKMSEVFDDYSPLQLFATGHWPDEAQGKPLTFTVIGRLQYRYGEGTWNEWLLGLDDGRTGWLSEDNGGYVLGRPLDDATAAALQQALGSPDDLALGHIVTLMGTAYSITSLQQASLLSAQGELPKLPPLGQPFTVAEMRSATGTVLSVEWMQRDAPGMSLGRTVKLEDLQLQGLRDDTSEKTVAGRQFDCPNCGSPVAPVLSETQSITCKSCRSIIDLQAGVGGELRHAVQDAPIEPTIPLGSAGRLQGKDWQVVGFQHRVGQESGDDEIFGWSEYLLYNRQAGFQFLVESTEGWSLVAPITGAPSSRGKKLQWNNRTYQQQYSYTATTDYVAGEFYWQVMHGQRTYNIDYRSGNYVLSREEGGSGSGREVVWSAGSQVPDADVARAFGISQPSPITGSASASRAGFTLGKWVLIIALVLLVLFLMSMCSDSGDGSSGSSGSSGVGGGYGGYSSGGGHK